MKQDEWHGPGPDGARGYKASDGMKAILGGDGIDKMNKGEGAMSPAEMLEYIRSAPLKRELCPGEKYGEQDYNDAARRFAREVLVFAESNRERFLSDGLPDGFPSIEKGLSIFQGGWAVNAVRYALEAVTSVENPSVVTVGSDPVFIVTDKQDGD